MKPLVLEKHHLGMLRQGSRESPLCFCRSTKSEKMYPSMLARGSGVSSSVGEEGGVGIGMGVGVEPYYSVPVGSASCTGQHWSQPTSPTPTHTSRQPPNLYQHVHKDDDSEYRAEIYR